MTTYVVYFGSDPTVMKRYGSTPDRAQAANWIRDLIDDGHHIRLDRDVTNGERKP